ncbi:MAG: hypothetical protein AB9856_06470 [Cellulosilyticaceae bacterium]
MHVLELFRSGLENCKDANADAIDLLKGKIMDKSKPWDMGWKHPY